MLFSPNAHALLLGQRNVALLLLLLLTLAVVRAVAMQHATRRAHRGGGTAIANIAVVLLFPGLRVHIAAA